MNAINKLRNNKKKFQKTRNSQIPSSIRTIEFSENSLKENNETFIGKNYGENKNINTDINKLISKIPINQKKLNKNNNNYSVLTKEASNMIKNYLSKKNKVNIINTSHHTIITARKFSLANKIKTLNYEKNLLSINENVNVTDFIKISNKTRYSYYPVVNDKEECVGILRVSDVAYDKKQKVILVDHNTYEQSARGLEEAEILEIIDHHNIGSIGTNMPISFRNMPVGSSNTIIYSMFRENNIEIPRDIAAKFVHTVTEGQVEVDDDTEEVLLYPDGYTLLEDFVLKN